MLEEMTLDNATVSGSVVCSTGTFLVNISYKIHIYIETFVVRPVKQSKWAHKI